MKRELRRFLVGVLLACVLLSSVVFADGVGKKIDVVFNKVNITVNGAIVEGDNILYNGTTYVPLRKIAEMLDKEVGWDKATNTATIKDKDKNTTNALPLPIVSQNAKSDGVYVGSLQSNKYHFLTCKWAEKILKENEIWFDSKEDAANHGYIPCGVCKP